MSLESVLGSLQEAGMVGNSQLCELGKIKIGGLGEERKSQSGGTYRLPKKQDHFTITTLFRDPKTGDLQHDVDLMASLIKDYGDSDGKLRRIPIRLLSDELEDCLQTAFVWYGGKTVGARSDGVKVTWFNNPKDGKKLPAPKEEDWNPDFLELKNSKGDKLFKVHSVLNCVIAAKEARWGGVYKFRTTSIISLRQLHASLVHLATLTGGIMVGMPLQLVMRPLQVAPNGQSTTVHVVHVELRGPDMMKLQEDAVARAKYKLTFAQEIKAVNTQYKALLAAPGTESAHEAEDIAAEFAPETSIEEAPKNYGILDGDPVVTEENNEEEPDHNASPKDYL